MPAPAAPPPAAAPAAAPKPAPAAAPAPKPPPQAPSREDNEPSFMGEYAAELDKLSGEDLQPTAVRKPKAKTPDKPGTVKPPEDGTKQPEGETKAGENETPSGEAETKAPAAEPTSIPGLRKAYTELKKKTAEEYEPKIQKLEARVKELESSNPEEVTTLQSRLEAAEKRRDELENEIHFVDYSKSADYREKFEKPYQAAWSKALGEITQLSRFMPDGSTRKAVEADILALANSPLDELDKKAEEWFPNSAARVIRHVEKIKDLAEAQSDALEKARTEGAERAKTSEITRKASTEKTVKMLEEAHTAIATKWPHMFGPVEDDTEGNALLEKGEAMYQKAFRPTADNGPKNEQEAIQLHALVRNKVRNHDRLWLWLKQSRAKNKELESALAEYEASNPNGGLDKGRSSANGGGIKAELASALDELDALDKKQR